MTVTTAKAAQPVLLVYAIVAVPAATPVTSPAGLIVAVVAGVLLHIPPAEASASKAVLPRHIFNVPLIAAGWATTVINWVAKHPPGIT